MISPAGQGWTVPAQTTGIETPLLFLAGLGIFRRRIMRWILRRTLAGRFLLARGDPVWVILNGGKAVRVTSQDGDYE